MAAIWYSAQWQYVLNYRTNYGYGPGSLHYQHAPMLPLVGSLPTRLDNLLSVDLYLPLAALVLVGLVLAGWFSVQAWRRQDGSGWHLVLLPPAQIALLGAGGVAALCSTDNSGSGFELPMVPLLVVLAVAGWSVAIEHGMSKVVAGAGAGVAGAASIATLLVQTLPMIPLLTVSAGVGPCPPPSPPRTRRLQSDLVGRLEVGQWTMAHGLVAR